MESCQGTSNDQCGPAMKPPIPYADKADLIVIGLAGEAGVGKTSISNAISSFPWSMCLSQRSIATPIKHFLESLGIRKGHSDFRTAAQSLSIIRDSLGPDTYVRRLVEMVEGSSVKIVIIDDIRFQSEIDYIRRHVKKTLFIRVLRQDRSPQGGMSPTEERHCSESNIPYLDVDFTIDNRKTLHEAASMVWTLATMYLMLSPPVRAYIAGPIHNCSQDKTHKTALEIARLLVSAGSQVYAPQLSECIWGDTPCQFGDSEYTRRLNHSTSFLTGWANVMIRLEGSSWGADYEEKLARSHYIPVLPSRALTGDILDCYRGQMWAGNVNLPQVKDDFCA